MLAIGDASSCQLRRLCLAPLPGGTKDASIPGRQRMRAGRHCSVLASQSGASPATPSAPPPGVGGGPDLGDFGARDPFPGEIATGFGDRVLGDADTEHKKLIPSALSDIVGLASRSCGPQSNALLTLGEARELVKRLVGWRLVPSSDSASLDADPSSPASGLRLVAEWKLKDFACAMELLRRVAVVAEAQKHHPDMHLEGWNRARLEIASHSLALTGEQWRCLAGGLAENDFILAAKIDLLSFRDLIKKDRFWA